MSTLSAPLRRQLERAALDARNVAEVGARKALEALAVHEPDPYRHMDEAQRTQRRKLRAQAKQLGDGESQTKRGAYFRPDRGRKVDWCKMQSVSWWKLHRRPSGHPHQSI